MKRSRILQAGIGTLFALAGVGLLASLVGWLDDSKVYQLAIPVVLIVSGVNLLSDKQEERRRIISFGLIAIGIVMLLVRFNIIQGEVVNGILGAIFFGLGVFILTRLYSTHTDKSA